MKDETKKQEVFIRSIWLTKDEYGELARGAAVAGWSVARYVEDLVRAALQGTKQP